MTPCSAAVRYVLGRPGLFVNSWSNYELLADMLDAAKTTGPAPDDETMAADQAEIEIRPLFDGTELERI